MESRHIGQSLSCGALLLPWLLATGSAPAPCLFNIGLLVQVCSTFIHDTILWLVAVPSSPVASYGVGEGCVACRPATQIPRLAGLGLLPFCSTGPLPAVLLAWQALEHSRRSAGNTPDHPVSKAHWPRNLSPQWLMGPARGEESKEPGSHLLIQDDSQNPLHSRSRWEDISFHPTTSLAQRMHSACFFLQSHAALPWLLGPACCMHAQSSALPNHPPFPGVGPPVTVWGSMKPDAACMREFRKI